MWEMKPHTRAKHVILENYLKAWFPIMSFTNERILYIDGFAGPGRYTGGEDGSPIMALKIAYEIYNTHSSRLKNKEFVFVFIESNKKNYESLQKEIGSLKLPKNFTINLDNTEFENTMSAIIEYLNKKKADLAPAFAFIDPFGTKGVPFDLVKQIMSYKKCEIFLNHMYFGVLRSKHIRDHTDLYGTDEWKEYMDLEGREKHTAITNLYAKQLHTVANVNYTRSFEVRTKTNATLFDMIYATNNLTGLEKMKEAMWKADPLGNYFFRDKTRSDQLVLFEYEPDLKPLRDDLLSTFSGQQVSISDIEKHVLINTPYLKSHIRRKTLTPLEKEKIIEVKRPPHSYSGFKDGTKITFPI
nr:hypothetical protein 1 [Bacillales bacterium]